MKIPDLTPVEYLIEEGRLPGLMLAALSLLGTLGLVIALFVFPSLRDMAIDRLATIVEIAMPLAGAISGFKTWVKHKNDVPAGTPSPISTQVPQN